MNWKADAIVHEVRELLDRELGILGAGSVSALSQVQWREYRAHEARINALLKELDGERSHVSGAPQGRGASV